MRTCRVWVATKRSVLRINPGLVRIKQGLVAAYRCLGRDIQRLIHLITDRSSGTYNAWLASLVARPGTFSVLLHSCHDAGHQRGDVRALPLEPRHPHEIHRPFVLAEDRVLELVEVRAR